MIYDDDGQFFIQVTLYFVICAVRHILSLLVCPYEIDGQGKLGNIRNIFKMGNMKSEYIIKYNI